MRTHRPEVLKSPAEDRDSESVPQETKKKSGKEKKEKKKDKEKDRKVRWQLSTVKSEHCCLM